MVELPMNHSAYAKTIFRSRNFRIQKADLDDVVQSALADGLARGCGLNDTGMKGYLFISCMRFIQTTSKRNARMNGQKVIRTYEDSGLSMIDVGDDLTAILQHAKSLPDYLKDTLQHMLVGGSIDQISAAMSVKPRTVSVNKCRVVKFLRNSIDMTA